VYLREKVSFVRLNLKFEKKGDIMKSNHIRYAALFILLASMPFYFGCESDVSVGSLALTVIKGEKWNCGKR